MFGSNGKDEGGFLRSADYYSLSGSVAIPNPVTATVVGVAGQIIVDKNFKIYIGAGPEVGKSTFLVAVNLSEGFISSPNGIPNENEVERFCTGTSANVGGGFGAGCGKTVSNGTHSSEIGIYTPQFGGSTIVTTKVFDKKEFFDKSKN